MALPFDRLHPSDKQIIESLKVQTENLSGQTKVLHSLSKEIIKLRKETSSANNKTAKDFQNLFGMMSGGFSDIKNYLKTGGGSKGSPTSSMPDKGFFTNLFSKAFQPSKYETKMMEEIAAIKTGLKSDGGRGKERTSTPFAGDKNAQPDRGFFSNLFNKVFGPSKYQTKMMEETVLLRELSERQSRSLEFLAEQNTDSKRAKERDALATAIVNKMKMLDLGGDGGGGGMLSTLGKALLAGIGGAIALLGRQISLALRGLLAGLKLALKGIEFLLDKIFKNFPKFPPTAGPVPGQGPVPAPGAPGTGGIPPVIVGPGGENVPPERRLPGSNDPKRLPGPNNGRYDPRSRPGGNFGESWKGRNQPPTTVGGRFSPGGAGRGIALALVALGTALGFKIMIEDEEAPGGSMMGGSVMDKDSDPTRQLLDGISQEIEMKRMGVKPRDKLEPGEALRIAGKDKFIIDPYTGQQITAEQFKKRYSEKLKPEEKKELDKFIEKENLEEEALKKERERLEQEEKGLELQEDYNSVIQSGIDALKGFTEAASEITLQGIKEKIIPFLDQLGEISIQGQKINLAPGLGTAMAKSLEDSITLGKELAEYTADTISGKNSAGVSMVNNTNNNVNNSTTTLPPASSKRPPSEDPLLQSWGLFK